MAIVDKTHSQTIEEAFNSVAEGGGGALSIKVIPYKPQPNGGFVKDYVNPINPTFYTYEELLQIFAENNGLLYAIDMNDFGSRTLGMIHYNGSSTLSVSGAIFETPSSLETGEMYVSTYEVTLDSSNVFTATEHVWYFSVTNDD